MKEKLQLAKARFQIFLAEKQCGVCKKEEGSHLVEVLGVIIIAVVLLVLFREEIVDLFKKMLGDTTTEVEGLFKPASVPSGG